MTPLFTPTDVNVAEIDARARELRAQALASGVRALWNRATGRRG